ncbi:protein-disulfide isomerase [Pedobacter glucosidilyticus]|nr:DsbA family protein [Pedobacter glucosidilyticus]KHJ37476.1 protein-disulfide isomerase [Pedobacter glucosidilyticus]
MENNPLVCDPVIGFCEIPESSTTIQTESVSTNKPLKVLYFTDPICSSCWAIEPQLRKLKLQYGDILDIEYRMGGLLPDWGYNSGGISKPADVAGHWDEVSIYYDMPIDGDVWLEDPLSSSYPPSIAFKAAQIQDEEKAILFLRELREMVFMQKKNIAKWEHLELAGQKVGLNIIKLKTDFEGQAKTLFEEDLSVAKQNGVRGFPTIFFINKEGQKELVYGSKPFSVFENTILKLYPEATKKDYTKDWETLFSVHHTLTAKEFSELTEIPRKESEDFLNKLTEKGKLNKLTIKNGSIWLKS